VSSKVCFCRSPAQDCGLAVPHVPKRCRSRYGIARRQGRTISGLKVETGFRATVCREAPSCARARSSIGHFPCETVCCAEPERHFGPVHLRAGHVCQRRREGDVVACRHHQIALFQAGYGRSASSQPKTTEFVVKLGGVEQAVGVKVRHFPCGGEWLLFVAPCCGNPVRVLRLLEGAMVCTRCCTRRGVRFRCESMSVRQRAELRIPEVAGHVGEQGVEAT
jgi:hypothetical protein